MSIRVMLAPMFQNTGDAGTLEAAFGIAKRFGSHVDVLFAQRDPTDTVPLFGEGASADTIRRLTETAIAAAEQQREAARRSFDRACVAAAMPSARPTDIAAGQSSAAWIDVTGASEECVAKKALLSDLVVFGTSAASTAPAFRPTFEAVLLKARRPIVLVPSKNSKHVGRNVALAWNGTAEAASALAGAMPFLKAAATVHLLTAATTRTAVDRADDVANYLAWHDIGSERRAITVKDEPVGAALMREAVKVGADLLIMGGYGHYRLRERILGGVTHYVLNHADLTVLMAH